eukprot:GHRR01013630.1.p1 GENE.GHRR01013630.1~~GHRR01013630.1.p1  ORF type:complete len:343 (+),score=154.91 GHRR01013630.1:365-1393(+)
MASELSRFIEDELRNKGYAYDEDEAEADNPHQTLIGALRVEVCAAAMQPCACLWELSRRSSVLSVLVNPHTCVVQARVKEQETQKKLFNIKRIVCIGGGVALVLVAWALLIANSKNRTDPEYSAALTNFEGFPTPPQESTDRSTGPLDKRTPDPSTGAKSSVAPNTVQTSTSPTSSTDAHRNDSNTAAAAHAQQPGENANTTAASSSSTSGQQASEPAAAAASSSSNITAAAPAPTTAGSNMSNANTMAPAGNTTASSSNSSSSSASSGDKVPKKEAAADDVVGKEMAQEIEDDDFVDELEEEEMEGRRRYMKRRTSRRSLLRQQQWQQPEWQPPQQRQLVL